MFSIAAVSVVLFGARPSSATLKSSACVAAVYLVLNADAAVTPGMWANVKPCLADEITRRTVRVQMDRGACSGVLIDARTVRTAAHCFSGAGNLRAVRDAFGKRLSANFQVTYGGPAWFGRGVRMDQAELRADRDVADLTPIPIVDALGAADDRRVLVAGFPFESPLRAHAGTFTRTWRLTIYGVEPSAEIAGDDGWVAKPGNSGGPVFLVSGCALSLLGTVVGGTESSTFFNPVTAPYHFDELKRARLY